MKTYTVAHYAKMSGMEVITHSYVVADSLGMARKEATNRGIVPLNIGELK